MKPEKAKKVRKGHWKILSAAIAACAIFFVAGWYAKGNYFESTIVPDPIRLGGYQFIDPLLSCNYTATKVFPENQSMQSAIQNMISQDVTAGDISKGSAYFANFSTGEWAEAYNTEMYYPSSLGKIPIMMAYYELAETNPSVLNQEITYPVGNPDLNDTQDIQPAEAIQPGQTYTVEQLIEYMIKYSDNNAADLLTRNLDPEDLTNVYNDLQIPVDNDVTASNADFITAQQIATLFRVLYNGTYLSHDYSEQALQLMSESSFTQGLVAGVPSSTPVSHKLGLVGITSGGVTTEHELHDCGIIYAPSNPYLLCVMTRGSSSLATMEGVIANISQVVYQKVTKNN